MSTTTTTAERAQALLEVLAGPAARLRADQATAIEAVVDARRRALVVQRTGFGKSAIYFVATRLLRDAGAGPTLVVSPLLALMRNQLEAAERAGSGQRRSTAPTGRTGPKSRTGSGSMRWICCSCRPSG